MVTAGRNGDTIQMAVLLFDRTSVGARKNDRGDLLNVFLLWIASTTGPDDCL